MCGWGGGMLSTHLVFWPTERFSVFWHVRNCNLFHGALQLKISSYLSNHLSYRHYRKQEIYILVLGWDSLCKAVPMVLVCGFPHHDYFCWKNCVKIIWKPHRVKFAYQIPFKMFWQSCLPGLLISTSFLKVLPLFTLSFQTRDSKVVNHFYFTNVFNFSRSAYLLMRFVLVMNIEISTVVGGLKFISRIFLVLCSALLISKKF